MNVIRPEVSLNDSALFLLRQLMEYLPELTPQLSEDTLLSDDREDALFSIKGHYFSC